MHSPLGFVTTQDWFVLIFKYLFFFLSLSSSGFVWISPRGLEIMKKTKPQKTFSWSRKKVFSSPIHHEKNQKNEKTKKKNIVRSTQLVYCFQNFLGKLNPKKLFPKITRWQHGCHQCSSHQATTRRKTKYWRPCGQLFMYYFRVPPPQASKKKNQQKASPAFISTPLSAVRQDLNALLNHINFLCILFSFMYLCYNTLSSKPFV